MADDSTERNLYVKCVANCPKPDSYCLHRLMHSMAECKHTTIQGGGCLDEVWESVTVDTKKNRKREWQWARTDYAKMSPALAAEMLFKAGYRQTSRRFGHVSRVDISVEQMKEFFIRNNFGKTTCGVPSCSIASQCDHYRRVYSKDRIEGVPENVMKLLNRMH